ncbi:hypothetical protein [Silvimonas sp.]|uniref:hypothetical protein n=1 Tax=Silvimonas sp. TaxID=2650811 RepID=UPI00284C84C9|nr:hypothetical protein [Silvimonas sp.]MDR3427959.1 hypothetical protein [Silvimonas sp.]
MIGPSHSEALSLKHCHPVAMRLYLNGLLKIMDTADGRVRGPRRLLASQLVTEVGPVAFAGRLQRPLQFGELGAMLDQLADRGLIESHGDAAEMNLLMVHRAPKVG